MADKKLIITSRKYSGETSVVSARLPIEMIKSLDHAAKVTNRNRNEVIALCLEYALDNLTLDTDEKNKSL